MSTAEDRLRELGLELPPEPRSVANYAGAVCAGDLVFTSGHAPIQHGEFVFVGKVGRDLDVEQGKDASRLVALNLLATLRAELRDLDRIIQVVKLLVFVNSDPSFTQVHVVADGASDLLGDVLGQSSGPHARSAVGMATLPFDVAVEIEGVFKIR